MGTSTVFGIRRETVYEFEHALLWRKGVLIRPLSAGRHWLVGRSQRVQRFDARAQLATLPGQEVLSSDGVTVKVSAIVEYRVEDPTLVSRSTADHYQSLYAAAQLALRYFVGGLPIEELLSTRAGFGQALKERCEPAVKAIGLELLRLDVKDIMFPGDLKKTFAQVAAARQEGLAALERARGESAALRNLTNAASLIKDHPDLLRLRLLQEIGEAESNTFVLGDQSLVAPTTADN